MTGPTTPDTTYNPLVPYKISTNTFQVKQIISIKTIRDNHMTKPLLGVWRLALVVLACIVVGGNGQQACPSSCKSYLSIGNLAGKQEIGPAATIGWNALSKHPYSVDIVYVSIFVAAEQVLSFELNSTNLINNFNYSYENSAISGNGTVILIQGNGMGLIVPQLIVHFQGYEDGSTGGINGSVVVFDTNVPDPSNYRDFGSVRLSWTACISKVFGPVPILLNATVWVTIEGVILGANYIDVHAAMSSRYYSIGGPEGPSLNLVLTFIQTGIMLQARICDAVHGCDSDQLELFSTALC